MIDARFKTGVLVERAEDVEDVEGVARLAV
jgi:hypothetical protein